MINGFGYYYGILNGSGVGAVSAQPYTRIIPNTTTGAVDQKPVFSEYTLGSSATWQFFQGGGIRVDNKVGGGGSAYRDSFLTFTPKDREGTVDTEIIGVNFLRSSGVDPATPVYFNGVTPAFNGWQSGPLTTAVSVIAEVVIDYRDSTLTIFYNEVQAFKTTFTSLTTLRLGSVYMAASGTTAQAWVPSALNGYALTRNWYHIVNLKGAPETHRLGNFNVAGYTGVVKDDDFIAPGVLSGGGAPVTPQSALAALQTAYSPIASGSISGKGLRTSPLLGDRSTITASNPQSVIPLAAKTSALIQAQDSSIASAVKLSFLLDGEELSTGKSISGSTSATSVTTLIEATEEKPIVMDGNLKVSFTGINPGEV